MKTSARPTPSEAFRELLRRTAACQLSSFVSYTKPDYQMGWVHREICTTLDKFLQDVMDKKSPRLIITLPPRAGKSELISRRFPAYALGRYPDLQIIATSYGYDLSQRFNKDVQRIIDGDEFHAVFPDVALSGSDFIADSKGNKGKFARTNDLFEIVGRRGVYRSSGVGGGITGMGCDCLIIDDPFKDRAEAGSATIRQSVWDWYTSTAYTRLSAGGGVIVMATRWHVDDLIGRLVQNMETGDGDKFTVVNYPAIAEEDEKHRKAGEALHPQRFGLEQLLAIKRAIGSRDWMALYQQHPVVEGGELFKTEWVRYYDAKTLPPKFDMLVQSWDMTFKDSNDSDFVVGQVWGRSGASFYLVDQVRGRWDFVKTKAMVLQLTEKHPKAIKKMVEDKANGSAIISALKKTVIGLVPITPKESKVARASAVTPLWEAGNVFLPEAGIAPWVGNFVLELTQFPQGKHDDQCDAMSQALSYMMEHQSYTLTASDRKALMKPPSSRRFF